MARYGSIHGSQEVADGSDDLNNIILCVGELHVVMTQLRTIGALIENSGIDMVCRI